MANDLALNPLPMQIAPYLEPDLSFSAKSGSLAKASLKSFYHLLHPKNVFSRLVDLRTKAPAICLRSSDGGRPDERA
jgi:hypothetical protein